MFSRHHEAAMPLVGETGFLAVLARAVRLIEQEFRWLLADSAHLMSFLQAGWRLHPELLPLLRQFRAEALSERRP